MSEINQTNRQPLPESVPNTKVMSTAKPDPLEEIFNAADEDGTRRHTAELAKTQSQQEVLKCTLAAQDQLDSIRREYGSLRSLVLKIQQLQPEKPPTRSQTKFINELIRQEESFDFLAASLMCFVE